jgi:hypothetical protein
MKRSICSSNIDGTKTKQSIRSSTIEGTKMKRSIRSSTIDDLKLLHPCMARCLPMLLYSIVPLTELSATLSFAQFA